MVRDFCAKTKESQRSSLWIIADQNGEVYRANEWGHALVHLIQAFPTTQNVRMWLPAIGFGDTGAASGGVAACQALRAFARNYHVENDAIVLSSSPWGERAAFVLGKL